MGWQKLLFAPASPGFVVLRFGNSRGKGYALKAFLQKAARTSKRSEQGNIQNEGTGRKGAGERACNGLGTKAICRLEAGLATQFRLEER